MESTVGYEKIAEKLEKMRKELISLRKSANLTQREVALAIGITSQSYQAYESGIAVPTLQNFIRLTILFDVTPNDLLDIE